MQYQAVDSLGFLLTPVFGATLLLLTNVLLCRGFPRMSTYWALAFSAVSGCALVVVAVLALGVRVETAGSAIAAVLIFLAFCYVYFHFNNMGETARRIRLLWELAHAPVPLSAFEINGLYGAKEMLRRRIERLLAAGQVRRRDGHYVVENRSVLWMALIVGIFHRIVFGQYRRSRFENGND